VSGPAAEPLSEEPLLEVRGLTKVFPVRRGALLRLHGTVRALDGVDLEVRHRECLALVGESGSGKTTLGRCILRLVEPSSGSIRFEGEDLLALSPRELRRRRRRIQMVFQDPYDSLDPRQRVGSIVAEPLRIHTRLARPARAARVAEMLGLVGLEAALAGRLPHALSGGQRQRVGIARALAVEPELLVADEPVSSLDVTVRAQVLDLLADLRGRLGLAMLFIAHDLAAVARLADRVAVLYLGRVVEVGPREAVLGRPLHPYTASLISAVPRPEPGRRRRRIVLQGEPPSPLSPPGGCPFHPRCPVARPRCAAEPPPWVGEGGHRAACFFPGELAPEG
jgi:oligopeptide/dipeptide ABC transporter ATP-binding protein